MMIRFSRLDRSSSYRKKTSASRGKFNIKKSDCHIHATLNEQLNAIRILHHEHSVVTLCRVLKVKRSTYYKRFSGKIALRANDILTKARIELQKFPNELKLK